MYLNSHHSFRFNCISNWTYRRHA